MLKRSSALEEHVYGCDCAAIGKKQKSMTMIISMVIAQRMRWFFLSAMFASVSNANTSVRVVQC